MDVILIIFCVIIIIALIYSILKEREELGCYRVSIGKQCNEEDSVYLLNTKMKKDDSIPQLNTRIKSILSYHEKGGVWRRCLILATILVFIAYILLMKCNNTYTWIVVYIAFIAILYFFFNYINYHHFRNLKNNGVEILETLISKCKL